MKRFKCILLLVSLMGITSASTVAHAALGDKSCEFIFTSLKTVSQDDRAVEIEITDDASMRDNLPFAKFLADASKRFPAEILAMYSRVSIYLAVPLTTRLRLTPSVLTSDNATASEPTLHMGVVRGDAIITRKDVVKTYWKHPNFSLPLLRHETGHIIFNHNLALDRPGFARYFKNYQEAYRQILTVETLKRKVDSLKQFIELRKDDAVMVAALQREITESQKLIDSTDLVWAEAELEFGKPYLALFQRSVAYQELFGDVVSVIFSDDPNAVMKALPILTPVSVFSMNTPTKKGVKKLAEKARERKNATNGQTLLRGFDNQVREGTLAREEHGLLWQARQHIWRTYLSTPGQRSRNGMAVIAGLYRALRSEIDWLEQNPGFQPLRNQSESNDHVIRSIDLELAGSPD